MTSLGIVRSGSNSWVGDKGATAMAIDWNTSAGQALFDGIAARLQNLAPDSNYQRQINRDLLKQVLNGGSLGGWSRARNI